LVSAAPKAWGNRAQGAEESTTMTARSFLRIGLAIACLVAALPALAVDVVGTNAPIGWTAASGPVSSYGVFLSRNNGAFPATPNQFVSTPSVTVTGATGDTLLVKVAAYDASGTKGPESQTSDLIQFVAAPGPTPPPPPAPAVLSVAPSSLTLSAVQGLNAASQSVTVKNTGGGTLNYLTAYSHDWIVLSASSGSATTETDTIGVSFATSMLPAGNYNGSITVLQTDTPNAETTIPVTLTVTAPPVTPPSPALGISVSALTATAQKGQSPASQSFNVRNTGGGTLSYTVVDNASWLGVAPASGTSTGENDAISLSFSTASLNAGTYTANVTVSASGLPAVTIPLTLTITPPPAVISLAPASLSASTEKGKDAAATSFTVKNTGGGTLSYSVADNASWLSVSVASGTATTETDTIGVSFSSASLNAGTYTGAITVSASGATSQTVSVTLTVADAAAIAVSTNSIAASVEKGKDAAATSFTVRNAGAGTLTYVVAEGAKWLALSPANGTSTGESDTIGLTFSTAALKTGSYTTDVMVFGAGVPSQTVTVGVTVITPVPALGVSTTSLSAAVEKGKDATATSFTVRNSGGGTLSYTVADDQSWLNVSPASGTSTGESDTVGVSFSTASLNAGTYTGAITVSGSGVPSQTVSVSLTVNDQAPALDLSTASLSAAVEKGKDAAATSFTVRNAGGGTLSYAVADNQSWLGVSPASGTSTGESDTIGVSFSTASLNAGSYTAAITVSGNGVPSQTVSVSLTVNDQAPAITLSTSSLSAVVEKGKDAAATSFTVRNAGGGTLSYTVADNQSWLGVSPASGTSTGESDTVGVSFSTASLNAGSYTAAITVSGSGVPSQTVSVSLTVNDQAPALTLSTSSLSTVGQKGKNAPSTSFTVRNTGGGTLSYSVASDASWLAVGPASGTATTETDSISVSYATAGLDAGSYGATIVVSGSGTAAKTISVSVTVTPGAPALEVSTTTLDASGAPGQSVDDQSFTVRNAGDGSLSYAITSNQPWVTVSPASGSSTGESDTISVSFSTTSLGAGANNATLTVTAAGQPSKTIAVSLQLKSSKARLDLDGDGHSDALFRQTSGAVSVWMMDGTAVLGSAAPLAMYGWVDLAGVGDFDGDGKSADMLWFDSYSGGVSITMNDAAGRKSNSSTGAVNLAWRVRGVADFDGDGTTDVLWVDPASGNVTVWLITRGTVKNTRLIGTFSAGWDVVAAGDFDGDGKSDVLFENVATRDHLLWLLDGLNVLQSLTPSVPAGFPWTVGAAGDFNGDGKTDILASYLGMYTVAVLFSNGTGFTQSSILGFFSSPSVKVGAAGDYDGDGKADVLWFDPSNGVASVWMMGNDQFMPGVVIGTLNPSWKALDETGTSD
jgi:hypothetical protein